MNRKIKLSVIVPVYNVECFLERCLNSILAQDFSDYELIIIDDGSTDCSAHICDRYAQKDDRIVVLHKRNSGLSTARNAGIKIARADYILFIDSDDYIEKGMFSNLINCLEKTKASMVCAGYYDVYGDEKKVGNNPQVEEMVSSTEAIKRMLLEKGVVVSAWSKAFAASLFDTRRFPAGLNNEDIYIMSELMIKAKNIYLCPKVYYNYCHRENSISTKRFDVRSFDLIIATKHSTDFIIKNDMSNQYYARAALYDSICAIGKQYFASDNSIRKQCAEAFNEHIIGNINQSYNWFQSFQIDSHNESQTYCIQHYLNMYAVLLSSWKGQNLGDFRKKYKHELKRLKSISNLSVFRTPFLFYEAYPVLTSGYRIMRYVAKRTKEMLSR